MPKAPQHLHFVPRDAPKYTFKKHGEKLKTQFQNTCSALDTLHGENNLEEISKQVRQWLKRKGLNQHCKNQMGQQINNYKNVKIKYRSRDK